MQPGQLVATTFNYNEKKPEFYFKGVTPDPTGIYTVKFFGKDALGVDYLLIEESKVIRAEGDFECGFTAYFWRVVDENTELNVAELFEENVLEHA